MLAMFRSVNIMFYVGAGEWGKGLCSYIRLVKYLSELKEKTEDYQETVGSWYDLITLHL